MKQKTINNLGITSESLADEIMKACDTHNAAYAAHTQAIADIKSKSNVYTSQEISKRVEEENARWNEQRERDRENLLSMVVMLETLENDVIEATPALTNLVLVIKSFGSALETKAMRDLVEPFRGKQKTLEFIEKLALNEGVAKSVISGAIEPLTYDFGSFAEAKQLLVDAKNINTGSELLGTGKAALLQRLAAEVIASKQHKDEAVNVPAARLSVMF